MISRTNALKQPALATLLLTTLVLGCGEQVLPKGTGASGEITQVLPEPDVGLELINKLTPAQQKSKDWLHQPFDKVITPVSATAEKEPPLQSVKEGWNGLEFANEELDVRYEDSISIFTNHGSIRAETNTVHTPNHVRNLILLLRSGFFVGKKPSINGDVLWIGSAPDQETYHLESENFAMMPLRGAIIAREDDSGKSRGTEIGICLKNLPELRDKVTIFAAITSEADDAALTKIQEAVQKEPGSVVVERVEGNRKAGNLFTLEGVRLPSLDENGRPKVMTQTVDRTEEGISTGITISPPPGAGVNQPEADEEN